MGKAAKAKKAAKLTPDQRRAAEMDEDAFPNDFVMDGAGNMLNRRDVIQALSERVEVIDGKDATFVSKVRPTGGTRVFGKSSECIFTNMGDFRSTLGFGFVQCPQTTESVTLRLRLTSQIITLVYDPDEEEAATVTDEVLPTKEGEQPRKLKFREYAFDDVVSYTGDPSISHVRLVNYADVQVPKQEDIHDELPYVDVRLGTAGRLIFVRPDFTHTMCTKLLLSQIKKQATDTATLVAEQEANEKRRVENIRAGYVPPTGLEAYSMSVPEGGIKCDDNALTVEGLNISAPRQQLFVDASFRIVQGHRYGLLGPNGYGKTTLLRHIQHGAIPVSESWDVFLVEQEAHATDSKVIDEVLSADATTVKLMKAEEDIMKQLDEAADDEAKAADTESILKLQDQLEEIIKDLSAREADKQEAKVRKILAGLGFTPEDQEKPVRQFSGGWRMRVSLARALFMQPKLLMLDEPTNHLDLDAVLWLDHYLAEEYPFTVLVVSHDADFLDSVCTDIISVENKKLLQYRGGYTDFQRMHEQQFAKQTKEWDLLQRQLKNCKSKADREALLKKKAHITKPVEYRVKFNLKGQGQDDRLGGLGLRDVSFSYSGKTPFILNHVEFGVDCTSRIAVVGANGSGKSTFLKLLTSELEPTEGEIMANHGLRVELFSQHFEEKLDLALTPVEQILQVGRGLPGAEAVKTPEKARQILGRYGLPSESHVKHIGNLSGGQKARVAFALLGLRAPHLLILDEPTNHLDIETVEALIDSLEEYDGGVVVVSHDARLIKSLDCEMWICSDGTVWRFGGNFDKYRNRVLAEVEARERRVEQQMEANRKSKLERHAARLGRKRAESAHVAAEAQKKAEAEAAAGSQPAKLELTGPKNGKKAKLGIAAMMDEARKKRKEESKKKRMQEQKEKEEEAALAAKAVVASEPVVSKAEKKRSKEVESVSEEASDEVEEKKHHRHHHHHHKDEKEKKEKKKSKKDKEGDDKEEKRKKKKEKKEKKSKRKEKEEAVVEEEEEEEEEDSDLDLAMFAGGKARQQAAAEADVESSDSEEDSDDDEDAFLAQFAKQNKKKGRRAPTPPPPESDSDDEEDDEDDDEDPFLAQFAKKNNSRGGRKVATDDSDDDEDSAAAVVEFKHEEVVDDKPSKGKSKGRRRR